MGQEKLAKLEELELGSVGFGAAWRLRCEVLLDPFGIDHELAREDDLRGRHLALMEAGQCVATLMLVPLDEETMRMRQVAVVGTRRRRGLGRRLVEQTEALLSREGGMKLVAHVRDEALPFYLALGYERVGEPFLEVGLAHHLVEKAVHAAAVG